MLRYLIKTVGQSAILHLQRNRSTNSMLKVCFSNLSQERFLLCSATTRNIETPRVSATTANEIDADYIVQYKADLEKPDSVKTLINNLRTKFCLSSEEVDQILSNEIVLKNCRTKSLLKTLDLLCAEGITKESVIEYPWLIASDTKKLSEKINLLKILNGFRDINDFVPFIRLQIPRMGKLIGALNREIDYKNYGNRVYFIAETLNVEPCVVTKYLAKRLFVLEMPSEIFQTNLEHMVKYKVEPMSILKDLWGFRYAPKTVELRLQRALLAKKDRIMPWMVRCPEPILQKSLQLSLDELQVLAGRTVAEYIGQRLGFSAEEAQAIMDKHPQVNTVRVTKIKEVLDYLLDEAKFTRHEIAQVPRVLCHKLETMKERIEELKKYGCRPTSLVIVCRSKREYEKFLQQWQKSYKTSKNVEDLTKDNTEQ